MTATFFSSKQICTNTWLIQGDGCTSYLVVGDECGVVVDTGFATENIQEFAQSLTNKPVKWAANTHGHFDHTGGNGWFELAFMSAKALEIARTPYPSKIALAYPLDYPVKVVDDGDTIDLGNRVLEIIEIPAHAPSSIAFLDRKERILFTGDEVAPFVMLYWMQNEPQPTIEQHAKNMEKLLKHSNEFDYICWGHGLEMIKASLVDDYLEHDHRILSGLIEGGQMKMFEDGPEDFCMYQIEFKRISTYINTSLCYDIRYVFNR